MSNLRNSVFVGLIAVLVLSGCGKAPAVTEKPVHTEQSGQSDNQGNKGEDSPGLPYTIEVAASGLDVPWELVVSPDGRLFFTERSGLLRVIDQGKLIESPVLNLQEALYQKSEAGLLGLALDPDFASNHYMYLYQSYLDGGDAKNRIIRIVEENNQAKLDKVLLDGLPASQNHNGGRLKFGPDGMLYITNGDASDTSNSQDLGQLSGKIMRIQPDGSIPADNPFGNSPVYSLGHRNPQGLAWDPDSGRLYSSEHGQSAHDEINLIEAGANYGWPLIQGDETESEEGDAAKQGPGPLTAPILHSGKETWAPSGMAFITQGPWKGNLLVANLRGAQIQRLLLGADGQTAEVAEFLFSSESDRLRDIVEGPDGSLYVLTNNRDGRGRPGKDDDRIIRLRPTFEIEK
ncbi:PQQ-dependent sugar dehydrogenase [Paenibacillus eucommiae]|uniref:Glucose/arabinose dehydrogenase n=1 Tax=Paenibacillus eucommiae TaxID=1355755 RepID=A0ABS4JAB5_9BACL|nr:PQQ-dependent sugar dehydrogenase [Paenibacillus eucommiae]MBP1995684.1 glucose/arabinose dehydrogenase [Paenibacillus eucommiae]